MSDEPESPAEPPPTDERPAPPATRGTARLRRTPPPEPEPAPEPEPKPKRRRRPLSRRKKLAFALTLALAPVLLLELGLRLVGWPTQRVRTVKKLLNLDKETFEKGVGMFEPSARRTVAWPPELSYTIETNSLGLRGPETPLQPSADTTRILALGDSTTFGFYVEEKETWPAHLQAWLHDNGRPVEVVNGGCGGWGIEDHYRFLADRAIKLEPDLVVLLYCNNDISDLQRATCAYETQRSNMGGGNRLKKVLYATAIYELILRGKIALKRWRQERAGEVPHPLSDVDVPPELMGPLWGKYTGWLEKMRDLLKERGIPLVVVHQPDSWKFVNGHTAKELERLEGACKQLDLPFVTAQPEFERHQDGELFFLPIDPHPAQLGYRLIAESIGRFLLDEQLLPGRSE